MAERQLPKTSGQLTLSETSCNFTLFGSLPPELRQMVWEVFMDSLSDKSELLIHEPSDFVWLSDAATPVVHIGFPSLAHVNREARYIAQKRVSFVDLPSARCMIPVRPFRPELDVLYVPREAWRSFFLLREFYYGDVWLSQLQHLAVDICLSVNLAGLFRPAQRIPSLRTLRILFPSEHGPFLPNSMIILPSPIPRCALRQFPASGEWYGELNEEMVFWDVSSYMDLVIRSMPETAVMVEWSLSQEAWAVVQRFIGGPSELVIEANILTRFQHSQNGSGFVEIGNGNIAQLALPVT